MLNTFLGDLIGLIAILWAFHVTPTGDLMELDGDAFPWMVAKSCTRQGDDWDSYETLVYNQWPFQEPKLEVLYTYHI